MLESYLGGGNGKGADTLCEIYEKRLLTKQQLHAIMGLQ